MNIKYTNEDIVSHHGIAAVIKDAAGKVLVQEHVKYGFWTIPVGKVKSKQDVVGGLKEEIFEECNLQIEEYKEMAVEKYYYEREGKEITVIGHLFEIIKYSGEMENMEPHKHKQQLFMPIEDIKKLTYLSDLTLLYLNQLGFKREAKI
jgi:8-oxo-dGTP pyrophosphatase MutT (NUDIX family)